MTEDQKKDFISNLNTEYYKIVAIISDFDKNLITVKGWSVTLGLVALGAGLQYRHYGFFLIAFLSGIAFWLVEAVMKSQQTRYFNRMREIEVINSELSEIQLKNGKAYTPTIDWSWWNEPEIKNGKYEWKKPQPEKRDKTILHCFFMGHVFLPHLINVIVGGVLYILGLTKNLDMPF